MSEIGEAKISAFPFNTRAGMPSGPLAFFGFKLTSCLKTEKSDVQKDWLVSWEFSIVSRLVKQDGNGSKTFIGSRKV